MSGVERGQGVRLCQIGASKSVYWPAVPPWETTHIAFPTDAESLAQTRERAFRATWELMTLKYAAPPTERNERQAHELADAVMRLLFGQDGEGT